MKRLINLNGRPLDGTSAPGPPLASRRSNGLHRVLVWPMAVRKSTGAGTTVRVCRAATQMKCKWRLYVSYQSKFAATTSTDACGAVLLCRSASAAAIWC